MKNTFQLFPFLLLIFLISCDKKDPRIEKIETLCLSESKKIAGMSAGLIDYCACAAPKILARVKDDQLMMAKFDRGEFNHINQLKDSTFTKQLDNCVDGDKLIYNPPSMEFLLPKRAENGIRITVMDNMDSVFQATHNMDKYCDCYVDVIKTKLTYDEFYARDLDELPRFKALIKTCEEGSRTE